MINKIGISLLVLLSFSCDKEIQNTAKQEAKQDSTQDKQNSEDYLCIPYKKVGKILPTHTYADLEKIFDKKNVRIDTMIWDGTITGYYTYVKVTPTQELQVYWQEGLPPYKTIEMIKITTKSDKFKTIEGIGAGSTLADLVKVNNGKPFKFSGFEWENGGGCCKDTQKGFLGGINTLSLQLPTNDSKVFSEQERSEIFGDQLVSSDLPVFEKFMPTVDAIYIYMNK